MLPSVQNLQMIQYQSSVLLKLFNLDNTNILLETNSCKVCWQWLKWLGMAENRRIQVSFEDPLQGISALFPAEVPSTVTVAGIQQQLHPGGPAASGR